MKKMLSVMGMAIVMASFVPTGSGDAAPPAAKVTASQTASVHVEGMRCEKCVARLTEALRKIAGVQDVQVSLTDKKAVIRFDPRVTNSTNIVNVINDLGYEARIASIKE